MHPPGQPKQPTFFWQGVLILLPVIVLAGLGLLSQREDRRLAEEQARDRASELVTQVSRVLAREVAALPPAHPAAKWSGLYGGMLMTWPRSDSFHREQLTYERERAAWLERFPQLDPDAVLLPPPSFSKTGDLLYPPPAPLAPQPPPWIEQLSLAQREAWENARAIRLDDPALAQSAGTAWTKFLKTDPPPDARTNAAFALLRSQLATNASDLPARLLWRFVKGCPEVESESGLPLSAVACGLALQGAPEFTEELFRLLRLQVDSPSVLTATLLRQAEESAKSEAQPVRETVHALQEFFGHQQYQIQLLRQIPMRQMIQGPVPTNFWMNLGSTRFLVCVRPSPVRKWLGLARSREVSPTDGYAVRLIPKLLAEALLDDALRRTGPRPPKYLATQVLVEGEPMRLRYAGTPPNGTAAGPRLLADARGSLESIFGQGASDPENSASAELPASERSGPGRPGFQVQAYLAAPDVLYRDYRRRSRWLGAIILAAAAAAIAGFLRARRAFLHERQLNLLKTNFVSSVSHELRAPVASVRLMAESLQRGKVTEPGAQHEYFRLIVQECRRLSSLIGNVLDYSRIEQGRKTYHFEPTDLKTLVGETLNSMKLYASDRGVTLREQAPDPVPGPEFQPSLDGAAIQQALVNLIDNALKHSSKDGEVTVGWESVQLAGVARVRIWVEDHGPGIPRAEQEKIFERFYRVGSELCRETEGVGIGLSIVKHIVEAHGGRVLLESEVGQGSRFILELPVEPVARESESSDA